MIITKELEHLLSLQKRKDARERLKKVYNALLYKKGKSNGFFQCPSSYLKKTSSQYNKAITLLLEHSIIAFQSFNIDESDMFNTRRKKYYNTEKGICARYRFLIDTTVGYEEELAVDFSALYDNERWHEKTRLSLIELGFPYDTLNIKRDNFSRRLHTNITGNIGDGHSYKDLLAGGDYWTIDAKTCHPRLLWQLLKDANQDDENLSYVFDNDIDFYDYIIEQVPSILRLSEEMQEAFEGMDDYVYDEEHIKSWNRSTAKEAFMSWINGTGYVNEDIRPITKLFPIANSHIRGFKSNSYKDMARMLQYKESTIFIDNLLNDIDLKFCLTMHDSLIVKKEDVEYALAYCQSRYPELAFEAKEIKR